MANATGIYGLRPVRKFDGTPYNGQVIKCYVSASYATALYIGDPVLLSPTLAEKEATGKYPTINKSAGTAGVIVLGAIVGFSPLPDDLTKLYNPASTERYAYVAVGSDTVFSIRGDGGTTLTSVVPGQNAVMIADSAGSTTTGLSGMALDEGTTTAPNTTQNFTLHILSIANKEDNAVGDNAEYEVLLNTDKLAAGTRLGITAA